MSTIGEESPNESPGGSATSMARILPADLTEPRQRPFAPQPGLERRRGDWAVQPLPLLNGASAVLVTGFEEGRMVLADQRFSSDRVRHPDAAAARDHPSAAATVDSRTDGIFVFMDPPEHTSLRRLLIRQFTARRMKALESRLTEIAVECIEAMTAAGTGADLVPAYALPTRDEDRAQAGAALYGFMSRLVNDKRTNPTDDILSGLVHDADPPLTDSQLVDMALVLLGAGHETTANMLALGTLALLENPDQLAALRADPALIDKTVEELLRYLSIVHLGVTRLPNLRLAVPVEEVPLRDDMLVFGVHSLPVTWA